MTRRTDPGAGRTRTTRPALSRRLIVDTALAMVDRDGIGKLSMRALGAELGADPMAVYHYFPSKAALFDGIVEAVYGEISVEPDDGAGWRAAMVTFITAWRDALLRHPGALPAIATRPISAPSTLLLIEQVAARLVAAGAEPPRALDALNCFAAFTIGHALAEVGEPAGGPEADVDLAAGDLDLSTLPTLASAFAAGYTVDFEAQYELGLTALLDGVAARLGLSDAR